MVYASNHNTLEAKVAGSDVQDHPQLLWKLKISLEYKELCQCKKNEEAEEEEGGDKGEGEEEDKEERGGGRGEGGGREEDPALFCSGFVTLFALGCYIPSSSQSSHNPADPSTSSICVFSVPTSQHFHSSYPEHFSCSLKQQT